MTPSRSRRVCAARTVSPARLLATSRRRVRSRGVAGEFRVDAADIEGVSLGDAPG